MPESEPIIIKPAEEYQKQKEKEEKTEAEKTDETKDQETQEETAPQLNSRKSSLLNDVSGIQLNTREGRTISKQISSSIRYYDEKQAP